MNLVFVSDRLIFTPLDDDDFDLGVEQWTDPEVVRYVASRTYTIEELREEMPIVKRRGAGGCIGIWALTVKDIGEKIGTALLLPMPVEDDDTDWDLVQGDDLPDADIEIGYVLKRAAWGQGYATGACKRLLQFAFEESPLQEVVACIDPGNAASRNVLLKSGLRETGLIRAYTEMIPGFKLTKAEWLAAKIG